QPGVQPPANLLQCSASLDAHAVCFFQIGDPVPGPPGPCTGTQPVMLDDHSKVDPLLPIPNRTVKRLRADDSGWTPVKVGHRQASIPQSPCRSLCRGFVFSGIEYSLETQTPAGNTGLRPRFRR